MKLTLVAFIAVAAAEDKAVGTACTGKADDCGDVTKVCCGTFMQGKLCKTKDCTEDAATQPASIPNIMACNNVGDAAADWIMEQSAATPDATTNLYAKFTKDNFKCFSGAASLAAGAASLLAAASMI